MKRVELEVDTSGSYTGRNWRNSTLPPTHKKLNSSYLTHVKMLFVKTPFDVGSLPNSNEVCRTFVYLNRILGTYHTITSPRMGFDGCLLFLPKFLKLLKELLIILPKLA